MSTGIQKSIPKNPKTGQALTLDCERIDLCFDTIITPIIVTFATYYYNP